MDHALGGNRDSSVRSDRAPLYSLSKIARSALPFIWLTGDEFERGPSRLRADNAVDDAHGVARQSLAYAEDLIGQQPFEHVDL
jgi:hypothetical protein